MVNCSAGNAEDVEGSNLTGSNSFNSDLLYASLSELFNQLIILSYIVISGMHASFFIPRIFMYV